MTPVRTALPLSIVTCPTATPGTSVIEFSGPAGSSPGTTPS
ncbi:MAG TPA: hypothetical protein VM491_11275 [Burkholderiaceae bacterium]|nr:hypothetical protein [Burkholderiaceae bacterium]